MAVIQSDTFAGLLGRPDLAFGAQIAQPSVNQPVMGNPGLSNGNGNDFGFGLQARGDLQGHITAAMLAAVVVALAAMYWWTQEYQR